jgi:hypothetical protein
MTQLPEQAFAEASKLPEQEQDSFASLLLAWIGALFVYGLVAQPFGILLAPTRITIA